ncbi:Kdo hydroxylase family protein [Robbsia sp. KACC 23696]|uniref:Kdo hydroxylase family protein n=1 Tax=Robbsia sp. KACC 23696 TaxID=3149231 RepID=UPI00325BAB2C
MSASQILTLEGDWQANGLSAPRTDVVAALERGRVLYFPHLAFTLDADERSLLDPAIADPKRKNISLSPDGSRLVGVLGDDSRQARVRGLIARYQTLARGLIGGLLPEYDGKLRAAPTSLRLHRVETRKTSWRADDSRLHVDAFPSRPNHGERILRVFANVNPVGEPRVWRVGEAFDDVAKTFVPKIPAQKPGSAWLLETLRITKSRRTPYDHLMLGLHDAMKADLQYQQHCAQEEMRFPPGCVWVCFSDQTSHAVMSGQFMMEQTFFLPAASMVEPACAPLGVLERLTGKVLV